MFSKLGVLKQLSPSPVFLFLLLEVRKLVLSQQSLCVCVLVYARFPS